MTSSLSYPAPKSAPPFPCPQSVRLTAHVFPSTVIMLPNIVIAADSVNPQSPEWWSSIIRKQGGIFFSSTRCQINHRGRERGSGSIKTSAGRKKPRVVTQISQTKGQNNRHGERAMIDSTGRAFLIPCRATDISLAPNDVRVVIDRSLGSLSRLARFPLIIHTRACVIFSGSCAVDSTHTAAAAAASQRIYTSISAYLSARRTANGQNDNGIHISRIDSSPPLCTVAALQTTRRSLSSRSRIYVCIIYIYVWNKCLFMDTSHERQRRLAPSLSLSLLPRKRARARPSIFAYKGIPAREPLSLSRCSRGRITVSPALTGSANNLRTCMICCFHTATAQ